MVTAMLVKVNMLLVNATRILSLVRVTKQAPVPVAEENINPVFAKQNINIHHQTAHIHVQFRAHLATENIRNALVLPVLVPVLMVVKNIMLLLALPFAK